MRAHPSLAIARHELRIMRSDPSTVVFLLVMPLAMTALMKPLYRSALVGEGFADASGAEQAVPGMAVAFAAFSVGFAGFTFFREHGWGTWDRLRASPATSVDIMAGKVAPSLAVTVLQLGLLFALGVPLFGFRVRGSVGALVLVTAALALSLVAFGVTVTALTRTAQQLNAVGSVGSMVFAMLGGAFVPVAVMPGWARAVAPATPTYWAMRGLRSVVLQGGGLSEVLLPTTALLAFGAAFTLVAATRFRFEDTKVYFG